MARLTIGEAATATLERRLDELMRGDLRIGDLPLAIEAFIHYGYALGRESRDVEVAELEHQVNHWYYIATVPERDRVERVEARLAQALEAADETIWAQIEQDLRRMRGPQPHTDRPLYDAALPRPEGIQTWNSTRSSSSSSERAA